MLDDTISSPVQGLMNPTGTLPMENIVVEDLKACACSSIFTCSFGNFFVSHGNLFLAVIHSILILNLGNIFLRGIPLLGPSHLTILVNLENIAVGLVIVVGVVGEGGDQAGDVGVGGGHDVAGLGTEPHILAVEILLD